MFRRKISRSFIPSFLPTPAVSTINLPEKYFIGETTFLWNDVEYVIMWCKVEAMFMWPRECRVYHVDKVHSFNYLKLQVIISTEIFSLVVTFSSGVKDQTKIDWNSTVLGDQKVRREVIIFYVKLSSIMTFEESDYSIQVAVINQQSVLPGAILLETPPCSSVSVLTLFSATSRSSWAGNSTS